VIWRGLPAFFLHQLQGITSVHAAIDECGTGEQDTTPDAMLAVNQYAAASLDVFMGPAGAFHHLLCSEWLCVGSRYVQ